MKPLPLFLFLLPFFARLQLLHDLDIFVMSVDTRQYFRSNSYNTLRSMCDDDEACANKYEFTFNNHLADYMNPVERISIPSSDLESGYYVIGVRARTLTESDSQTYGLAAAGGGLVLHDMAKYWSDLGAETQSTDGGNADEPNPDSGSDSLAPAPTVAATSSPSSSVDSSGTTGQDIILAPPGTPAPSEQDPASGGEAAVGDDSSSGGTGDDSSESTAGDGFRESSSAGRSNDDGGDDDDENAAGYKVVGGDDDDEGEGGGEEAPPTADLSGGSGSGESGWTDNSKIAIVASVASAVILIGVGICLARRRRNGGKDQTGSFLGGGARSTASGKSCRVVHVGDESAHGDGEGDSLGEDARSMPPDDSALPGYATAVACSPEEEGTTIISDADGGREVVELTAADESETSGFYAAVDPTAVSKLVGWGIGRDFARVALRQTENDIPEALKLIAEGNMDEQLAMDHEEMAQEGARAAVKAQARGVA